MANGHSSFYPPDMKTLLLSLLFGIFLKSGLIVRSNGNYAYNLACDTDTVACYFDLELPKDRYLYLSKDGSERITLLVSDTGIEQLGPKTLRIIKLNP